MFRKFSHSVVDVCAQIHDHYTGAGDPMEQEAIGKLIQWLEWRISSGWYKNGWSMPEYDLAVRAMAVSVINHYWGKEMV